MKTASLFCLQRTACGEKEKFRVALRKRAYHLVAAAVVSAGLLLAQKPAPEDLLNAAAAEAGPLWMSGRYSEAAEVLEGAFDAAEKAGAGKSPTMAVVLTMLGSIYHQLRLREAELVLRRAMDIWQSRPAPDPKWQLRTAMSLAAVYSTTGRFALSESLLRHHLSFCRNLEANSLESAQALHALGNALEGQRRYTEAESFYREAFAILGSSAGSEVEMAAVMTSLGGLQLQKGRHREASENLERALAIYRLRYGENHPDTIEPSMSLARVYVETRRPLEADRLLDRALSTAGLVFGPEHPTTGILLVHYARVLRVLGRRTESVEMERAGKAILEKSPLWNPGRYMVDVSELLANQ